MIRSIIKDSTKLRLALKHRWKKIKQDEVALDAQKLGQAGITRQGISKYLTKPYAAGALNDEQIIFLAIRWDVGIRLEIGFPDKSVNYIVPKQMDNVTALKFLKEIFPETIIYEPSRKNSSRIRKLIRSKL